MHHTYAIFRGLCASALLLFFATGCDLPVQPKFEFDSEIGELITFEDQTVWEWMNSDGAVSGTVNNNFDTLVKAIQLTGLVEEYNTAGDNRTFLMLNNEAFTGGGELFKGVFKVASLDELTAEQVDLLRNILRYHIVDAYVDQGAEALPVLNTNYIYQTLIPGEEGEISFNRDERFRVNINRAIELPGSKRGTQVRNHNYIFSNGVGHHIRDYVRNRSF